MQPFPPNLPDFISEIVGAQGISSRELTLALAYLLPSILVVPAFGFGITSLWQKVSISMYFALLCAPLFLKESSLRSSRAALLHDLHTDAWPHAIFGGLLEGLSLAVSCLLSFEVLASSSYALLNLGEYEERKSPFSNLKNCAEVLACALFFATSLPSKLILVAEMQMTTSYQGSLIEHVMRTVIAGFYLAVSVLTPLFLVKLTMQVVWIFATKPFPADIRIGFSPIRKLCLLLITALFFESLMQHASERLDAFLFQSGIK